MTTTEMTERDDSELTANALREELSLGSGLTRFAAGSVPVFAAGEGHVIKLFPASERQFFDVEVAALTRVGDALSVPTPRLVATGERMGWWFVVMTRLGGLPLATVWSDVCPEDRIRLMRDVGVAVAKLHALHVDDPGPLAVDWPRFVEGQVASCRERQLARGLGSPWTDDIDVFLARWSPRDDGRRALLHTEIMREHLLVERSASDWRLSGLFDFEPAMVGAPEYELASIGVFVTCGEPGLLRAFLDGYGAPIDDDLPPRIMVWTLLHRYSSLRWYLECLGAPEGARDLEGLARAWFTP